MNNFVHDMGKRTVSLLEFRKLHGSFTSVLASALLEWLLISMLLVNAFFGYIITKFACYCKLQFPCLLCSRIDHILGSEKVGSCWDMICGNHKTEISSLVFCHFHEKLVDVRGMCETCLFSFATKDKSNAETYRLLVGKLGGEDLDASHEDTIYDDQEPDNSSLKHCSCCNELWTSRGHAQTLLQTKSTGFESTDLDINDSKNEGNPSYQLAPTTYVQRETEDRSVHFGYTELKITSDTESEIHVSDNEDTRTLMSNDSLRDLILDSAQMEPFIKMSEGDAVCNIPIDLNTSLHEASEALCEVQSDIVKPIDGPSVTSASGFGHGLEELNWQGIYHLKVDQPATTEIINFNNVTISSNSENASSDMPIEGLDNKQTETPQTLAPNTHGNQELPSSITVTDINVSKSKSDSDDGVVHRPNHLNLGDAYKLAVSSRGMELSTKLTDQLAGKDSPGLSPDLKALLTQLSRGIELSSNDALSPRISRIFEEIKTYDSTANIGMKLLQKKISLERNDWRSSLDRNESGIESLDFSTVSEIEGESELDQLKRQHEHDRKFLIGLLKELEEERNASASSTNEAMAMITRLQEEKAALQMEASHDLRMMEEQAEYDLEALEKLNDVVVGKDKEIQDLEAELDYFRIKYPNESLLENTGEFISDENQEKELINALNNSDALEEDRKNNSKDSWLELEEREYILQCLNKLEKKLNLLTSNTIHTDLATGDNLENQKEENPCVSKSDEECTQVKSKLDENEVLSRKDAFGLSKGDRRTQVRRVHSLKIPRSQGSLIYEEADVLALCNEVSNLNGRLRELEADRKFLERVTFTLKNGDDKLIQEIASDLRELRMTWIRRHQAFS